MDAGPPLGTIVSIPQGRGVIRFSGTTSFSQGKWIGIELYEPNGKNDGSVQGVAYFTCKLGYGVFVRPSQIKATHGPEIENRPQPVAPSVVRQIGHQRTPSNSGLLRASSSIRNAPSSNASPRSASPAKPTVAPSPVRPVRSLQSPTKRTSLILPTRKSFPIPPSPSQQEQSFPPSPVIQNATPSPQLQSAPPLQSARRTSSSLASRPPIQATPPQLPPQPLPASLQPSTPAAAPQPSQPPLSRSPELSLLPPSEPQPRPQDDQELHELRAKIRVMEAKRADDARHVRELETRLAEAETFVALRPKLQAKLNSQQTELIATRRELADAQQLSQLAESRMLDVQEQLEMAMLDKEVAEEKAELAQTELEELKEKLAVVEVEIGVLKSGGDSQSADSSDGKDSLAYIQLEKQNERLKEALIRLRDLSQETDQDQRRRISELEKDVASFDDIQTQYESTLVKLANAETQVEDLKLQLDDALGAEEMLVQLTERNLMLGEKIEEMRITIEDLEALKELSDELEENHVETEKQLHIDLDAKDLQLHEYIQKIELLEDTCQDLENTIGQFRELVMQLQNELDDLRKQTQTAQHESATAASQTAAMMSLNLKLQSSVSKSQAKNIELEVKKLEAREARELLSIVQPYLPQLYVESDSDATSCYLLFQRLAYKADLINMVVAQAHGLPDSLSGNVSDVLVGICEMRARISGLSTWCKRFAAILRRCDAESFLNIGRVYPEIAPVEKRIDMHIDLLRRDEFREMECVSDIVKIQAQFDHLAETYFDNFEHDLAEKELGYAVSFDRDLDMFSASIGLTKTAVAGLTKEEEVQLDMGGYDIETDFFQPLQRLLDQCRSVKSVSKKLTKRLEDLIQESGALKAKLVPQFMALNNAVAELVNFGISLAQQVMPHLSDARSSKSPFPLTAVLALVKQIASSTVAKNMKPGESPWDAIGAFIAQLLQEGNALLPSVMDTENVMKTTGIPPWETRVAEIKASLAVNVEAERKVAQLNDELQDLVRTLRSKDQTIQESAVKIELMERRMETVKKQADMIVDLENELSKARKQERAYEEAMEQLQADLDTLEQDNAKLKTLTAGQERQATGAQQTEAENVAVEGSLETSYLLEQIEALRGTVRFLRTENSYLKGQDLLREIESLPSIPEPVSQPPTPHLVPSTLADSDESDSDLSDTQPTLRSIATESKLLYRDVIKFSSTRRVVDLSAINARRTESRSENLWVRRKNTPAYQVWERKMEAERLSTRVQGLLDRALAVGITRDD